MDSQKLWRPALIRHWQRHAHPAVHWLTEQERIGLSPFFLFSPVSGRIPRHREAWKLNTPGFTRDPGTTRRDEFNRAREHGELVRQARSLLIIILHLNALTTDKATSVTHAAIPCQWKSQSPKTRLWVRVLWKSDEEGQSSSYFSTLSCAVNVVVAWPLPNPPLSER